MLLARYARRGRRFTQPEIAAWCGCTVMTIRNLETRALRAARARLRAVVDLSD